MIDAIWVGVVVTIIIAVVRLLWARAAPAAARKWTVGDTRSIEDWFRNGSSTSDICVFTITARYHIPLTDILYLEYLRARLRAGRVGILALTVWHPDDAHGLFRGGRDALAREYDTYLQGLFLEFGTRVHFLDGKSLLDKHNANLPPLFWRAFDNLTSRQYRQWARNLELRVRSLRHMNRARPGDQVLRGLVAHTINNTYVAIELKELLEQVAAESPIQQPVVSVLFWELEVDRLAVFFELFDAGHESKEFPRFGLVPIAGRTIYESYRRPSDNHSPQRAIGLQTELEDRILAVSRQTRREVREYRRVIRAILTQNYSAAPTRKACRSRGHDLTLATSRRKRRVRLSSARYELLGLTEQLVTQHQQLRVAAARHAREGQDL